MNNLIIINTFMFLIYLIVCDMCNGVSINSNAAFFKLAPRKLASCKSLPDKSHHCKIVNKLISINNLILN